MTYRTFIKELKTLVSELKKKREVEPCPNDEDLRAYAQSALDDETICHVLVHMLVCTRCKRRFSAFCSAGNKKARKHRMN